MSASFTRKARYLTFGGIATLGLGIVAQLAVVPGATSVEGTTIPLHQTPPIVNSEFEDDENDCPGSPAQWGWHFIVTGDTAEFESLTAVFDDAGSVTITNFGPPSDKHAFVYTPTDDTLLGAVAIVSGADDKTRLVLSHTCGGTDVSPTTVSPTPSESVSPTESISPTPSESVSPTESISPTPSESVSPTESISPTPSESVSPTESISPTPSESVSPTESISPTPSESVSPTETISPTPSESVSPTETVLPTRFTNSPSETPNGGPTTISPSVGGVKVVRPGAGPGALPNTGTPLPVGLLLLLGIGMVVAGLFMTVTGQAHPAGGRYRR